MTQVNTALKTDMLPQLRGRYTENAPLGDVGWFRAGGRAEVLYKPADLADLQYFLQNVSPEIPIHIFGVMSNTIIRDGGIKGVVIRLGREFADITADGDMVTAGALALDGNVAMVAAKAGVAGLEFYSGIPGTIGGALRMNAGCYGTETKDVLIEARALDRQGNLHIFTPVQDHYDPVNIGPGGMRVYGSDRDVAMKMTLSYRHNDSGADLIFIGATFKGVAGDPDKIQQDVQAIKERRAASQPIREKTGGSTFANPKPEEIVAAGLPEGTKVWQLIDMAGCRGLMVGGAQMSNMHCNFMINTGAASAADLENLGEEVRRRVHDTFGITLRWEVRRVGEA